jgi:Cu(I)/Ag(I) efflux system membrane fusion protein
VNVTSRTTRVRMTLKNQALALVPGEYGTVEFAARAASKSVLVPQDALVDTGTQQYVFVERSPGRYSARLVHVTAELPGGFEVRGGVMPGETVVSGATFLLDSESRLRASIAESTARPARPTGSARPAPAPPATEHRH